MTFKVKVNYAEIGKIESIILSIEEKYNLSCLVAEICERKSDDVTFIHTAFIDRKILKPVFLLIVIYECYSSVLTSDIYNTNEMVDKISRLENKLYINENIYELLL